MASLFEDIQKAEPIEVFALVAAFKEDPAKDKVNLSVGAYRTDEGKPYVLPVVRTVEAQMAADTSLNHEYNPVPGLPTFTEKSLEVLLGKDSEAIVQNRVGAVQALGGTGALRLIAEFLNRHLGLNTVYVSSPTWGNHKGVFKNAGFTIKEYRYWNASGCNLNLEGMLDDLRAAPAKSAVILHAVAHNPTGVDPTQEQWKEIAKVCREKNIFVILDNAYQGFTSGDLDADAWSSRYFVQEGFEFCVAQSFSKNFGLYNERIGNVAIITKSPEVKARVMSQMELIVRTMWSNPPNHGARIVATILNNAALCSEWKGEIKKMAERIMLMRSLLHQKLKAAGCPGNWDHIIQQRGMFSYTGLNEEQSRTLTEKYHIYLLKSGRINMCGLTPSNMDYVVRAITDVVSKQKSKV